MLGIKKTATFDGLVQADGARLMAHLLDANIFIEAKYRYYDFSVCPVC